MKTTSIIFLLILYCPISLISQTLETNNIWYFGYNAGIDFNTSPPTPLHDGQLHTDEGCSSICDSAGQLIFYTNGIKLWNKNHKRIANTRTLGGHTSTTQSALIVPFPQSENKFYLFSVDAVHQSKTIKVSLVDMSLNNGQGDLTSSNTLIYNSSTEKIAVIKHHNNTDYWIIAHGFNTRTFAVWALTDEGLSATPQSYTVGSKHDRSIAGGIGYMKGSPDGSRLALAINGSSFELFDFDNSTGGISNPKELTSPLFGKTYAVEFSPNSKRLYLLSHNAPVFQINLDLPTSQRLITSLTKIGEVSNPDMGAMQNAPNGKIYIANYKSKYLSVIHYPNKLGTMCKFRADDFYLGGKESSYGLPNLIPSVFDVNLNFELTLSPLACNAYPTIQIVGNQRLDSANYSWFFENQHLKTENNNPNEIIVKESGTYLVEAEIFINCEPTAIKISREIEVIIPEIISHEVITQTPDCSTDNGAIVINAKGGLPPLTYSFDGGGTYQSINTQNDLYEGEYLVEIKDSIGCKVVDTIELNTVGKPVISHISTTKMSCGVENGRIRIKALSTSGELEYSLDSLHFQNHREFTDLGEGIHTVYVRNNSNCVTSKEVKIKARPIPFIQEIIVNHATCGGSTGSIEIEANGGKGELLFAINDNYFQANNNIYDLAAGSYSVKISDENNCEVEQKVSIKNKPCPVFIPNAFSPNGDGNNDVFRIYTEDQFDATIRKFIIFDRWGSTIYSTENFSSRSSDIWWDGRFNGQDLNPGVYVYTIELEFENGEQQIKAGDITLVK